MRRHDESTATPMADQDRADIVGTLAGKTLSTEILDALDDDCLLALAAAFGGGDMAEGNQNQVAAGVAGMYDSVAKGRHESYAERAEVRNVEAHFERYSERFRHFGTTKEEMVGAFRRRQQEQPGLTAAQFLRCR